MLESEQKTIKKIVTIVCWLFFLGFFVMLQLILCENELGGSCIHNNTNTTNSTNISI